MSHIHTVYFEEADANKRGGFERLLEAFKESHSRNSPSVPLTIHHHKNDWTLQSYNKRASRECRQSFVDNTNKMRAWNDVVQSCADGEVIMLMDCDTLILKDLSDMEEVLGDHDLAFTVKTKTSRFPFNSGVIITRINPMTRMFFTNWLKANEDFLGNGAKHETYRARYGGINQAALGYMLLSYGNHEFMSQMKVLELPCKIWNCENETWRQFSDETRILHVKSGLRKGCLYNDIPPVGKHRVEPLVEIWKQYATQ